MSRVRTAQRLAPLLAVLLMLAAPFTGSAQAAPDPCAPLKGTPSYEFCKAGGAGQGQTDADTKAKDKEREEREKKCEKIKGEAHRYCMGEGADVDEDDRLGAPGDVLDQVTGDCKKAPEPEAPGEGASGWFDSGPAKAPAPRAPSTSYLYEQYGFAGLSWNTYELACIGAGGALGDAAMPAAESWVGNMLFGITKSWTAFTVSLRQQAAGDTDFLDDLDPVIEQATQAVRDAVYNNWIGTSLVALGAVIVFQARNRDASGVIAQVGWALLVMTIATGVASYPVQASKFADDALATVTSSIDQAFADIDVSGAAAPPSANEAPVDRMTAHGNMLVHHVLYEHWLRGELGDADSAVAKQYGPQLFDAQALTWAEDRLPPKERAAVVEKKKERFKALAAAIKEQDPAAYSHLTGKAPGRLGQAGLSLASAASVNLFSNAADLVIITGKITIRFVVVLLPGLAVIGLHRRMAGTVKTGLHSIGAACINVPLFSAAAAVNALAVRTTQSQDSIPGWVKVVLLLVVTWALWRMAKPLRRMSSMANPNRNWVEDAGSIAGTPGKLAKTLGKGYLLHKIMRRAGANGGKAAAEEILDDADERDGAERQQGGPGPIPGSVDQGSWDEWTDDSRDALDPAPTRARAYDDVVDADAWYVEDLDPSARESRASISAAPFGSARRGPDADLLAVSGAPVIPGPLPGGSGAAAAVPMPRTRAHASQAEIPSGTQRVSLPASDSATPAATPAASADRPYAEPTTPVVVPPTSAPEAPRASAPASSADRPHAEPTAPVVVPPTIDEDGNHVYVLYDPASDGFAVQDDRVDAPEEGWDR